MPLVDKGDDEKNLPGFTNWIKVNKYFANSVMDNINVDFIVVSKKGHGDSRVYTRYGL